MPDTLSDLARHLAARAEAVCRHYLPSGRRHGRYWLVGDVRNTPGRSLYVRLQGPSAGQGAAGRWTDAATGEHGDLLDLIAANRQLPSVAAAAAEARRFLGEVPAETDRSDPAPTGSPEAARRLFAMARPLAGTLAETYLRQRGIDWLHDVPALRFHPYCFYRPDDGGQPGEREAWPALIAAVTDRDGVITGVQRTWLDPAGRGKAPVPTPRRAMGQLLGHAVRLDSPGGGAAPTDTAQAGVMAAGEGIETVLSLRGVLPTLPLAAALSANHLAALQPPSGLCRLYIARDDDEAGRWAAGTLASRMQAAGIEAIVLAPRRGDFNDDLRQLGATALATEIRGQLAPEDVARFWRPPERGGRTR